MSVVDVARRNTASQEDFEASKWSDHSLLFVEGGTGQSVESFSIEFTVGSTWSQKYGAGHNGMHGIPDDGIRFDPHASLVVEVAEAITVPYNMYGLVIPTGSLFLDRGIIIAAAKIEPAFTGKLKLRLVNTSGERQTLKRGTKIASGVFFTTETTRFQQPVRKAVNASIPVPPWWTRAGKWVVNNPPIVIGWLITSAVSSVSAFLLAYFVFPPRTVPAPPAASPTPLTASPTPSGRPTPTGSPSAVATAPQTK
jgi:dUTPase